MGLFRLKGQGGQATIEYVLLLIVSVSLLLALMTQVFTPLQKFLQAYMGTYVQCLLEYGELPALSGDSGSDSDSECNARFEDFSLTAGRPSKGGEGGSGSDGDGSSSGSGGDEENSSGGNGRRATAGSGGSGRSRLITNGPGTAGADGSGDQKIIEIEVSSAGAGTGSFVSRGGTVGRPINRQQAFAVDQSQLSERDMKRVQQQKKQNERSQASITEATEPKAPTRFAVDPPPVSASIDLKEDELTFGSFLRMLIIIGIILAIVIFVGGQFLQMSKSASE